MALNFIGKAELARELNLTPDHFRKVCKECGIETGRQKKLYPAQVILIKKRIISYLPGQSRQLA